MEGAPMQRLWTAIVLAASVFSACGGDDEPRQPAVPTPVPEPDPEPAEDAFILWQALYDGVSSSPADLASEAERLVQAGDPIALIEFVRDEIQTVPAFDDRWGSPSVVRFGRRGVLRAGVGTPRDKAELLFELLTEAGFSPEIRLGSMPSDTAHWDAFMTQRPRRYEPEWDDDLLGRARTFLGNGELQSLDGTEEADTEATRLLTALSTAGYSLGEFVRADRPNLPIVRFEHGGETLEANVFDQNTPAGEPGLSSPASTTVATGEANAYDNVEVSLSVKTTQSPDAFITLVSHSWTADEVVGRTVAAHFVPAMDPVEILGLPLNAISEFVPMLSLRGHDMTRTEIENETHVGDLLNLSGDIIAVDDGTPMFRGRAVSADSGANSNDVMALEVEVAAGTFPGIQLRVAALNASDEPVHGLPASAFGLSEDGVGQSFTLLQNDPGAPRVLFLVDKSNSVPPAYRDAALGALVKEVGGAIQAVNSASEFRIMAVNGVDGDGAWTQDLDVLEQAAIDQVGGGSALWRALADANGVTPTLVVFITDGRTTDALTVADTANIEQLGPILSVDVGGGQMDSILGEVSTLTGGEVFAPAAQSELAPVAASAIEAVQRAGYLFKYQAPADGPQARTLTLSVDNSAGTNASESYTAPGTRYTPSVLQVKLAVTVGGESVERIVAGTTDDPEGLSADARRTIQRELLAFNLVGFEGGDPTPHALAKDLLQNKINVAPLAEAVDGDDPAGALLEGALRMPVPLIAALRMPAAQNTKGAIYPTGLRAAMYRFVPGTDAVRESVDILPIGGFASAAENIEDRLEDALRTTARAAVVEASLFETSTLSLLGDTEVFAVGAFARVDQVYPDLVDPDLIARWEARLTEHQLNLKVLPKDPSTVAFWSINPDTGTATAILSDGTGGAATANQELALTFLNMLDVAATGVGVNWQLGFWISLSKAVLKQAIRATIAISTLGVSAPPDGTIYDAVGDVVCDMIKDKVFGAWGETGEIIDLLDASVEMYTGDGVPCTL